jgi:serine phosphatase RsbU (regulator of sigma subunit)
VGTPEGYSQRLTDIDDAVAKARLSPDVVLERAAGMLAGRIGFSVDEAHTHLQKLATEQGRDPYDVAAETLIALQSQPVTGPRRVRKAVSQVLRLSHRDPVRDRPAEPDATPPAWADVVQQTLQEHPGQVAALAPVRDASGAVEDFVIVAASPAATDSHGRQGTQLVGGRARQGYPAVVDGPVWNAWLAVLSDGVAREVAPSPVDAPARGTPPPASITIRVMPVGPGVLTSWVRHDDQARLGERLARTERLGNLGWAEWDLLTDTVVWSDELYRIYERAPADGPMPRQESEALTLPDDDPIRRQAAETFGRGHTIDIVTRIRVGDTIKHIRSVVDAERDADGRPVKVYGIVQDVTAREASRVNLAAVEQQLLEHQARLAAEHQLAGQLQQIILPIPATPIDLPGLRVAVRYLPAEQASQVGGDWYLATAADDGSVVLAIGDVAGHGINAAATMAQLRHGLAMMVGTTTTEPAALLGHLNRLLFRQRPTGDMATAVVARYDPTDRTLTWARAGHPPPLHTRGGRTRELDEARGILLGAIGDPVYTSATLTLHDGDLLLFFTDGLIEHRHRTLDEGLAPVIATLNDAAPGQPLDKLLSRLRRANPDDDTCLLLVRPLTVE